MSTKLPFGSKELFTQRLKAVIQFLKEKSSELKPSLKTYSKQDRKILEKYGEGVINMGLAEDQNLNIDARLYKAYLNHLKLMCKGEINHSDLHDGYKYHEYKQLLHELTLYSIPEYRKMYPNIGDTVITILENCEVS